MGNQCQTKCKKSNLQNEELVLLLEITKDQVTKDSLEHQVTVQIILKSHCISPLKPLGLEYPSCRTDMQDEEYTLDIQSSGYQSPPQKKETIQRIHIHQNKIQARSQKNITKRSQELQEENHQKLFMCGSMNGHKLVVSDRKRRSQEYEERKLNGERKSSLIPSKSLSKSPPHLNYSFHQTNDFSKKNMKNSAHKRKEQRYCFQKSKTIILDDQSNIRSQNPWPNFQNFKTDQRQNYRINQIHTEIFSRSGRKYSQSNEKKIITGILKGQSQYREGCSIGSQVFGSSGKQVRFKEQNKKK